MGFLNTQSYTYFAWRNSKQELTGLRFTEAEPPQYGNIFARTSGMNMPAHPHRALTARRASGIMVRLTSWRRVLGSSYGIWRPGFLSFLNTVRRNQADGEYLDSEISVRDGITIDSDSLKEFIGLINRYPRENPSCIVTEPAVSSHRQRVSSGLINKSADIARMSFIMGNSSSHHVHRGWLEWNLWLSGSRPTNRFSSP